MKNYWIDDLIIIDGSDDWAECLIYFLDWENQAMLRRLGWKIISIDSQKEQVILRFGNGDIKR